MPARHLYLVIFCVAVTLGAPASAQFSSSHWEAFDATSERLQKDMLRTQELLLPKASDSPQQKANFDEVAWCSRILGDVEREASFLRRLHKLRSHIEGQYGRDLMAMYLQSQTRVVQSSLSRGQTALAKAKAAAQNNAVAELCGRTESVLRSIQVGLGELE